jgi:hypothetical protein
MRAKVRLYFQGLYKLGNDSIYTASRKFYNPYFSGLSQYPLINKIQSNAICLLSLLVFFSSCLSVDSHAQTDIPGQVIANNDRKQIEIPRTNLRPEIDGVLDDEIWTQAAVITDFHQMLPVDHGEPSQSSVFYITYNEDYFYVAARLYDTNPVDIRARALLHDTALMGSDDRVQIILDTFNNKRTGFIFQAHPNGIRGDGVYESPSSINWNWDGIWETDSNIDEEGWVTEMAIPFTTLNFDPNSDQWGFSLGRMIPRTNEQIAWSSFNRNNNPSTAGLASGIQEINQGIGLDIVPSVTVARAEDHTASSSDSRFDPSLDVFYKFTPNLTGALTLNTDFSATEVDNRQVNLTRFSLFFPERRDFFLQDSEIFTFGGLSAGGNGQPGNTNGLPFHSRRIGLDPATGNPIDIEVGSKVAGRVGDVSIGALIVQQGDRLGLDGQNVFVGRINSNVLSESKIGVIMTEGDPNSETDSTLAGADFAYRNTRFSDTHTLTGDFWYQQSDTEGVDGDDKAYSLQAQLSTSGTGFGGRLRYSYLGDEFDPALGFANRTGIEQINGFVNWRYFLRNHPIIRNSSGFFSFSRSDRINTGDLQSENLFWRIMSLTTHSGDELEFQVQKEKEGLITPFQIRPGIVIPAGKYAFNSFELALNTTNQRDFSPDVSYKQGDFFNGERREAQLGINWTASRNLTMELNYNFIDVTMPEGDFVTRLISMNMNVAFNADWSWINLMQYDNESDLVGLNSRLRWTPRAGEDLFLVLNYNTDSLNGAFRGLQVRDSEVVLKYTRNFRF